jgi:hypothetical protein
MSWHDHIGMGFVIKIGTVHTFFIISVAAEEVGAREGAVAEAADAVAAAAGARTSPCLEKEISESASESSI